jgi:hypothetical protein
MARMMESTVARLIAGDDPLDFEQLALLVFAHQFENNEPYRKYCLRRHLTPARVESWRQIPAVSTTAFKTVDLTCAPAEHTFLTSGTTRGPGTRGRHGVPCLELYRNAALKHFALCVAPDDLRAPVLALVPPPTERPESSLVQMTEWIRETYGTGDGGYFVHSNGIELGAICERLATAARDGTPLYVLGITAAFEELFAHCQVTGQTFRLPYGSRIMDTGGSKRIPHGRHGRSLSRAGFLHACWRILNVPGYYCINEYGMTELCSQFYDNVLRERVAGRFTTRYKVGPPWTRTVVVDAETLEELPAGTPGLLRHFDLANCGSVLAVQTEDVGVAVNGGFQIHGRITGAEPRGCALLIEDMARANADSLASPARAR